MVVGNETTTNDAQDYSLRVVTYGINVPDVKTKHGSSLKILPKFRTGHTQTTNFLSVCR